MARSVAAIQNHRGPSQDPPPQSKDADEESGHKHFEELLQEVRIALPGMQILFAFLLTVPFTQRFSSLDAGSKAWYFASLLTAAGTSVFLIAPTAFHRLQHGKVHI